MNQIPKDGQCFIDLVNGTALYTYFTIYCQNWVDPDGDIVKYALSCKFSNYFQFKKHFFNLKQILKVTFPSAKTKIPFDVSNKPLISVQMPAGDPRDNYAIYVSVQVYDDADGKILGIHILFFFLCNFGLNLRLRKIRHNRPYLCHTKRRFSICDRRRKI